MVLLACCIFVCDYGDKIEKQIGGILILISGFITYIIHFILGFIRRAL